MQLPEINLDAIPDLAARQVIEPLLNVIEPLHAELVQLRAENQHLRDENARLKGGSGKPDIIPPVSPAPTDHSSEAPRRTPTARSKPKKNATLTVTRDHPWVVDPALLPPDAVRHGSTAVIVQDLRLPPDVIRFVREVWSVPSTGQTITAPVPDGYHGAFGPQIPALALSLAYDAQVRQSALLRFFHDARIQIGARTLARWLVDAQARWQPEAAAIHQAGLARGSWHASDQTPTRGDGRNETGHGLGHARFTVYPTRPGGSRPDVLARLWGQDPVFRLNDDALAWLAATALGPQFVERIRAAVPWAVDRSALDRTTPLATAGIVRSDHQRPPVWDALAVAAYHAQTAVPIIRPLLSDDAAVYPLITDDHARCGVHDRRQYAKLRPVVPAHQHGRAAFGSADWTF